jgi:integrase
MQAICHAGVRSVECRPTEQIRSAAACDICRAARLISVAQSARLLVCILACRQGYGPAALERPGPGTGDSPPMQTGSSHLLLTTGVATRRFAAARPPGTVGCVPLLAEYASTWLQSIEGLVRPRTLVDYTGRLERHVLPRLGEHRLDEIGIDEILALIGDLRRRGYAGSTICAVLMPLSRLFAHAVRRNLIEVNPISKLDRNERPRVSRKERPVLNRDEIGRLLEAAPPLERTLLATAIFTGLRQGELLGLRWKDIDFDNQVIRVRSALDRRRRHVPPKTQHALRDVVLMPALAQALGTSRRGPSSQPSGRRESETFAGTTSATPSPASSSPAAPTSPSSPANSATARARSPSASTHTSSTAKNRRSGRGRCCNRCSAASSEFADGLAA